MYLSNFFDGQFSVEKQVLRSPEPKVKVSAIKPCVCVCEQNIFKTVRARLLKFGTWVESIYLKYLLSYRVSPEGSLKHFACCALWLKKKNLKKHIRLMMKKRGFIYFDTFFIFPTFWLRIPYQLILDIYQTCPAQTCPCVIPSIQRKEN